MLGPLGPFGLAAANGLVIALWVLAPVVGGLLLVSANERDVLTAGIVLGVALGLAMVSALFLFGAGTISGAGPCVFDLHRSAPAFVLGILAVSTLVGAGAGMSLMATALLARRGRWLGGSVAGGLVSLAAGAAANFGRSTRS